MFLVLGQYWSLIKLKIHTRQLAVCCDWLAMSCNLEHVSVWCFSPIQSTGLAAALEKQPQSSDLAKTSKAAQNAGTDAEVVASSAEVRT